MQRTHLQHLPFVENFHGVDFVGSPHPHDTDNAKGSAANDFEDLEVILGQPELLNTLNGMFHWK